MINPGYEGLNLMSDLSERVRYNNPAYPIKVYKAPVAVYRDIKCASHWHDDFEFIIPLTGSIACSVNGEPVEMTSGQGIFINSRQLHNCYAVDRAECDFICLLINLSLLCANDYLEEAYISPLARNEAFKYMVLDDDIDWQRELMYNVRAIHQAYEVKAKSLGLTVQSLVCQIAALLYEHMPSADFPRVQVDQRLLTLRNMTGFVQQHYSEKINLSDIANAGNVSVRACSTIFQQNLHMTPMKFLTRYRLEKSTELLRNPGLSITEIALSVGFSGASYFSECFLKHFKLTPSEYKRG